MYFVALFFCQKVRVLIFLKVTILTYYGKKTVHLIKKEIVSSAERYTGMKEFLRKTRIFKVYVKQRVRWIVRAIFRHEAKLFVRYGMDTAKSKSGELARLTAMYHVIEKGLTMPSRRLGFGQPAVLSVLRKMDELREMGGDKSDEYVHAAAVLTEYYELHRRESYELEQDVQRELEVMMAREKVPASSQSSSNPESYWSATYADFAAFSNSRHSVRHYGEASVPMETIRAAIKLANNAPSACNRQPCRVYCLSNKDKIAEFLKIQGGNRGFGHLADKVLILTSTRKSFMLGDPFAVYVNGGIYLMNLSYALHYHRVAHCILGWSPLVNDERYVRQELGIDEFEAIICAFTLGSLPDGEFALALSPRKDVDETLICIY